MATSLIIPIYNEVHNVNAFLDSILSQSELPCEIIFVDGGSTDGTVAALQKFGREEMSKKGVFITIISDVEFSKKRSVSPIAKSRNHGVAVAKYDKILCTDAGCILSADWVAEMSSLLKDSELVVGRYSYVKRGIWSIILARSFIPRPALFKTKDFLPSSRSIAFTKELFHKIGGYPEITFAGEDTLFAIKAKKQARAINVACYSEVFWELPNNYSQLFSKVYTYGASDRISKITPGKYKLRTMFFIFFPLMIAWYFFRFKPISPIILGIQLLGYWSTKKEV